MFTFSQEAAKEFLIRENIGIATVPNAGTATTSTTGLTDISGTPVRGGPDHGVPTQIAVPHLSASTPGKRTSEIISFIARLKIWLTLREKNLPLFITFAIFFISFITLYFTSSSSPFNTFRCYRIKCAFAAGYSVRQARDLDVVLVALSPRVRQIAETIPLRVLPQVHEVEAYSQETRDQVWLEASAGNRNLPKGKTNNCLL